MRYLKLFLISFLFFFLFLTGLGLLFPSSVKISRAVDLPGQRRTFLMQLMKDTAFRRCWQDSLPGKLQELQVATDSSYRVDLSRQSSIQWIFHGRDGRITIQGQVQVQLGWLPWQRFQSLLLEPRYGTWLEIEIERFKRCMHAAQSVSVSP